MQIIQYINTKNTNKNTWAKIGKNCNSRRRFINAPAKCKTFIYVFPEICFQEVNDSALNF